MKRHNTLNQTIIHVAGKVLSTKGQTIEARWEETWARKFYYYKVPGSQRKIYTIQTTCVCFDFPIKLCICTYLACKTKINWKKNMWKVANRLNWVLTSLYTSFIFVNFGENIPGLLHSIRTYKLTTNYFFTILSYTIRKTISWAKNKTVKWVICCEERKMVGYENK